MKPDRWRKVDELFEAALEREPASRAELISTLSPFPSAVGDA